MRKRRSSSRAKIAPDVRLSRPTRVVLSGHQSLVRSGLRALLERVKAVEVREASDKEQLFTVIEEFKPHVIVIDVTTRELRGLDLLQQVVQEFPSTRALALTQDEDEEQALEALRLGAAGLIARNATDTDLVLAVKSVARGENYLSETLGRVVLKHSRARQAFLPKLTARQYEVLKMIAEGHGTKEIALRLNISPKTVETHRARVMERLNIRDLAGLVRYAVHRGLVKLDQ